MEKWLSLIIALIIIFLGTAFLTGLLFPDKVYGQGKLRTVMGAVILGYGLFRASMVLRRLKRRANAD